MIKSLAFLIAAVILLGMVGIAEAAEKRAAVKAPELSGGTGWLNTDRPIYIKDLKGKVVLLDFWTYCCINCIHVIPDLKRLEAKYADELVVIGVHSAKFSNEKDLENIRQAVLRYGIEHPVVNDSEFRIWRSYGVRAWPTLVLINPEGYIAGVVSGEGHYETLDRAISKLIDQFSKDGKLDRTPLSLPLEKFKTPDTPLLFPGKVLASADRLFISDSNHNRIVIADLDGDVLEIIGNGEAGASDGSYAEARFKKPQGMSLSGKYLYVADTENHLIRRCNLEAKTVETIAGTGQQAMGFGSGGEALKTSLSSPWDVIFIEDKLYIAMAGIHQIWVMDLRKGDVRKYAGSRREGRIDGSLDESALAQPSGLSTDGKSLFVADSETSSIRSIGLSEDGEVETIVGLDLFDFGDRDGKGREVRLQHPLEVLFHDGRLYVADTYNHKIKIIDPDEKTSRTFLGSGNPGSKDGLSPTFFEPGGLSISGNRLYIADTNNHLIRVADLSTGSVETLELKGLAPPGEDASGLPEETVVFPLRKIPTGGRGRLILNVKFPRNHKLTEGAPLEYEIDNCDLVIFEEADQKRVIENPKLPLEIMFRASDQIGGCQIEVDLIFNYCRESDGLCLIKFVKLLIPVQVVEDEKNERIFVEYKVNPL